MTQPWVPPAGNEWVDVTLKKRIGNPDGALTFVQGDQNKSDAENSINWLGNRIMELLDAQWSTGDIKTTFSSVVPSGWLAITNSTIGNATSGSTYTGNNYYNLYVVLWNFAVSGDMLSSSGTATTKGASAEADWAANKRIYLPDIPSRSIVSTGSSRSGLTNRLLGAKFGAESVTYTPQGIVSVASVSGITATSGAISTASLTVSVSQATATSSAIDISSVTGSVSTATATSSAIDITGVTATCGAIDINSLTTTVNLSNGPITGAGTVPVTGASCLDANAAEPTLSVMDCSSPLTVDIATIASALNSSVTVSSATIGGSIPSPTITIGGAIPTPTITVDPQTVTIGGAIPTPTITVDAQTATVGGSIPAPTITIGGSIAAQTYTGTEATISTLTPSIAINFLIKL